MGHCCNVLSSFTFCDFLFSSVGWDLIWSHKHRVLCSLGYWKYYCVIVYVNRWSYIEDVSSKGSSFVVSKKRILHFLPLALSIRLRSINIHHLYPLFPSVSGLLGTFLCYGVECWNLKNLWWETTYRPIMT